jgi:hypothetical protein
MNVKVFFVLLLLIVTKQGYCQNLKIGLQATETYNNIVKFKYNREYKSIGDSLFITTYKIYANGSGAHLYNVIAKHYKKRKEIKVVCELVDGGIFADLGKTDVQLLYESPNLQPYGKKGMGRAMNGSITPNYCLTQFVSGKFENVNVIEIQENENRQIYFLLDEVKKSK